MSRKKNNKKTKIRISKGDKVKIIAGKHKNTIGTVQKTMIKKGTVIIDNINQATKHLKPKKTNEAGQIITIEKPIHSSNIMKYNKSE